MDSTLQQYPSPGGIRPDCLHKGEFMLYYQPQVDLTTSRIIGYEGLMRWNKSGSIIPPLYFLDVLESSGLIDQVWPEILEQGVRRIVELAAHQPALRLALNACPTQVVNDRFAEDLSKTLSRFECSPALLEIEVTERGAVLELEALRMGIQRIKELGVRVILDDFGAGHSNLHLLCQLPVDGIKIDKYFTARVSNSLEREVIRSVVRIATLKGVAVLAEGVESREQEAQLIELGCSAGQGYLYGFPAPNCLGGFAGGYAPRVSKGLRGKDGIHEGVRICKM